MTIIQLPVLASHLARLVLALPQRENANTQIVTRDVNFGQPSGNQIVLFSDGNCGANGYTWGQMYYGLNNVIQEGGSVMTNYPPYDFTQANGTIGSFLLESGLTDDQQLDFSKEDPDDMDPSGPNGPVDKFCTSFVVGFGANFPGGKADTGENCYPVQGNPTCFRLTHLS